MNSSFLKQYGGDVKDINTRRDETRVVEEQLAATRPRNWKTTREIFDIDNTEFFRSALVDTSLLSLPKPAEELTPNLETYYKGRTTGLPDDMFMVKYNPDNFPDSYGRPRLSFDDIGIPGRDFFGVATDLGEKDYQLVGRRDLQRDIDFSRGLRERDDDEISLELIQQEKEKKRKKYLAEKLKERKEAQKEDEENQEDDSKANEYNTKDNSNPN